MGLPWNPGAGRKRDRRRRRPVVERLDNRVLLSFTYTNFNFPPAASAQNAPPHLAVGLDQNLWYTDPATNAIGRMSPVGELSAFPIPTAASGPNDITTGPDGNLWFTETSAGKIGAITPGGVITEYALPDASSAPQRITAGPDGALWFTETGTNAIGRITTDGVVTEYAVPSSPGTTGGALGGIAPGPDGALWFTDTTQIGRINPAGLITTYPLPATGPTALDSSADILAGPDGALWFTGLGPKIGRISTAGAIQEFPIQVGPGPLIQPIGDLVRGSDGHIWTVARGPTPQLIQIAPSGDASGFTLSDSGGFGAITEGPGSHVWVTQPGLARLARLDLTPTPPLPHTSSDPSGDPVTVDPTDSGVAVPTESGTAVPTDSGTAVPTESGGQTSPDPVVSQPDPAPPTTETGTGQITTPGSTASDQGQKPAASDQGQGSPVTTTAASPPPVPVRTPGPLASGGILSARQGAEFGGVTASFLAMPGRSAGEYSASIDWGDGVLTAGTINLLSGQAGFGVLGRHTYAQPGTYTVKVTINDARGGSATAVSTAGVLPAGARPVAVAPPVQVVRPGRSQPTASPHPGPPQARPLPLPSRPEVSRPVSNPVPSRSRFPRHLPVFTPRRAPAPRAVQRPAVRPARVSVLPQPRLNAPRRIMRGGHLPRR